MKQVRFIFLSMMAVCFLLACHDNAVDSDAAVMQTYEENPSTLDGVWHLVKASYGLAGIKEIAAGDITVHFSNNHTIQVMNKTDMSEGRQFLESGNYSYEVVKSSVNIHDNTTYTTIIIGDRQCVYWFRDGMLILDFGMASDGDGYFFKKLKN